MTQHALNIRPATVDDAPVLAELHVRSWQWAYRGLIPDESLDTLASEFEKRIEDLRAALAEMPPDARVWVVEQDGRVAGFANTGQSHAADAGTETAEVHSLYLFPEAVGQGIGRALFAHTVADLRQRGFERAILWVLESNQRGRAFYEAAGWAPDGTGMLEEWSGTPLREVRYCIVFNA